MLLVEWYEMRLAALYKVWLVLSLIFAIVFILVEIKQKDDEIKL